MIVRRGGDFDRWDLQSGNKLFAYVRCLLTVEEHGAGKQYVKIKSTVSFAAFSLVTLILMTALSIVGFIYQQWLIGGVFIFFAELILFKCTLEKSNVLHSLEVAVAGLPKQEETQLVVHKIEEEGVASGLNDSHKAKPLKLKLEEKKINAKSKPKSLNQVHGV
jgi:hypothetical protein